MTQLNFLSPGELLSVIKTFFLENIFNIINIICTSKFDNGELNHEK